LQTDKPDNSSFAPIPPPFFSGPRRGRLCPQRMVAPGVCVCVRARARMCVCVCVYPRLQPPLHRQPPARGPATMPAHIVICIASHTLAFFDEFPQKRKVLCFGDQVRQSPPLQRARFTWATLYYTRGALHHFISYYITSYYIICDALSSYYIILHYITSYYIIWHARSRLCIHGLGHRSEPPPPSFGRAGAGALVLAWA
jgi:hypothetical protein